jgi:AcrR family transcriptional regulator
MHTGTQSVARTFAPRQMRSRRTEERILAAAGELLAEKPFDQLSVAEIALRAHVSVGGFYARFRSKEDVLLRLHYEQYVGEMVSVAEETLAAGRWAGRGIAPVAQAYFAMMIEGGRRHLPVLRERVQRGRADPAGEVDEAYGRFIDAVHAPFLDRLRERMDQVTHPQPEMAVRFAFSACSSALREAILFPHMRPEIGPLSGDALAAELARMFCAYLGAPLEDAPAG